MRTQHSTLLALILAFVSSPLLLAQEGDGPTSAPAEALPAAKTVIAKMITAVGGREAMEKVTSRVATGELEVMGAAMKATFERWNAGTGKLRETMNMDPIGSFEQGILGEVTWALDPMQGARILEGVEESMSQRGSHLSPLLHVETDYKSLKTIGRETIGDKPHLKLEMISHDDQSEIWFVDESSSLRFRTESVIEAPMMGKIKVVFEESDYRAVDGVLIAHRTFIDQGISKVTIRTSSIEQNVEIDSARFALPLEVQKLIDKREAGKEPKPEPAGKEALKPTGTGG